MRSTVPSLLTLAAAVFAVMLADRPAHAQTAAKTPPPTTADWAALAKLPDFTGVWEIAPGGGADEGAARKDRH